MQFLIAVAIGILILAIYLVVSGIAYLYANPGVFFALLVAGGVIAYFVTRYREELRRRERIAANERERQEREADEIRRQETANRLRQSQLATLSQIGSNSQQLVKQLHDLVWQAEEKLGRAEYEFRERAFAPFWDAIEAAAYKLATYETVVGSLRADAENYSRTANGMARPVPQYPVSMTRLPQVVKALERLNADVRMAQRDFQFANIYEHRKANRLLVTGFSTLGCALTDLGGKLDASLRDLNASLYAGLSQLSNRAGRS